MPASIKKVIIASFSMTTAQIVTTLCYLITVPLLLSALGRQEYGLWILLMSVTGYFGLTHFGITYSLKNKVAYLFAEEKRDEINNFISACVLFYSFLLIFALGITYALIYTDLFPFSFLLSKDIELVDKATIVFSIVIAFYFFRLFVAGIISNVFQGLQEISRLNIFNAIYQVASAVIFIGFLLFRPSLIGVALFQGVNTIVHVIILYVILKRKFDWLRISFRISNIKYMKAIKTTSFYFLTGSILTTIIASTDNLVISHFVGLSFVFIYSILFRMFRYASSALPIATASWPTISSLYQKKEETELRKFYSQVLRLNVSTKIPLFFAIAVFSKEIISIWIGPENFYGYWLVIIFLLTWILWVWNGSNMVFINAMSLHKLVQLPLFLEATINITISILLIKYTPLGIIGVALGTLIGQTLVAMHYVPRIVSRQLDIKPFSEISKIIVPLLLPVSVLIGLKVLIDLAVAVAAVRYGLYAVSLGLYILLLYQTILKATERQIIKEKVIQLVPLVKRITIPAMGSSSIKKKYGVRYLWKEYSNPGSPKTGDLGYGQNPNQGEAQDNEI